MTHCIFDLLDLKSIILYYVFYTQDIDIDINKDPPLIGVNPDCQDFKRLSDDMPKYYQGSTLFNDTH